MTRNTRSNLWICRGVALAGLGTCLAVASPPSNDAWSAATVLSGTAATASSTTWEATAEPGEPVIPGDTAHQTVWWSWTAPANGLLSLRIAGSDYSTAVAVYAGESLPTLQLLADNHSVWGDGGWTEMRTRPEVRVTVEAGRRYWIAADWNRYTWVTVVTIIDPACLDCVPTAPPPVGGEVSFALEFQEAPNADRLADATDVSGNYAEMTADTVAAGREPGEPSGLFRTVWWRWVAPHAGWLSLGAEVPAVRPVPQAVTLQANLPQPSYDHPLGWPPGLEIPISAPGNSSGSSGGYSGFQISSLRDDRGTIGILNWLIHGELIEQNPLPIFQPALAAFVQDDSGALVKLSGGPLTETNRVRVQAGTAYYLALGSLTDAGGTAAFKLRLTAPENDDFSQRLPMSGVVATASGHLVGATRETNEPTHAPGAAGHSAWWTWTAPDDGLADWSVVGTNVTAVLAAYRGTNLAELQRIQAGTVRDQLHFRVAKGDVVQLAVDALGTPDEGDYSLSLRVEPLAPALEVAPVRLADGSLRFRVSHLRGRGIFIYASPDLLGWRPIWAGVVNSDQADFRDYGAVTEATRYYVVRIALPGEEQWFVPPPR